MDTAPRLVATWRAQYARSEAAVPTGAGACPLGLAHGACTMDCFNAFAEEVAQDFSWSSRAAPSEETRAGLEAAGSFLRQVRSGGATSWESWATSTQAGRTYRLVSAIQLCLRGAIASVGPSPSAPKQAQVASLGRFVSLTKILERSAEAEGANCAGIMRQLGNGLTLVVNGTAFSSLSGWERFKITLLRREIHAWMGQRSSDPATLGRALHLALGVASLEDAGKSGEVA